MPFSDRFLAIQPQAWISEGAVVRHLDARIAVLGLGLGSLRLKVLFRLWNLRHLKPLSPRPYSHSSMDAKPGDKPWHLSIALLSGRTVEIDADPNWHLDSKRGLSGFNMVLQGLCVHPALLSGP